MVLVPIRLAPTPRPHFNPPSASMAMGKRKDVEPPLFIGVGKAGLAGLPSRQTGRAGFPHPAFQSVVLPSSGLACHCMGRCHREHPMLGEERRLPELPACDQSRPPVRPTPTVASGPGLLRLVEPLRALATGTVPAVHSSRIHLPASLGSRPITALPSRSKLRPSLLWTL